MLIMKNHPHPAPAFNPPPAILIIGFLVLLLLLPFFSGCVNYGATTVDYQRTTEFVNPDSHPAVASQEAPVLAAHNNPQPSQEPRIKETVKFKGTFPKKMLTQGMTVKLDEDKAREAEGGGVVLKTTELEAAPDTANTQAHTDRDTKIGTSSLQAAIQALIQAYHDQEQAASDLDQ